MVDQKTKDNYIGLIKKINSDLALSKAAINFVEAYSGEVSKEFTLLVGSIVSALLKYEELKIKADSYDEMKEVEEEFEKNLHDIKVQFKDLEEGFLPISPPVEMDVEDTESENEE